MKISSNGIDLLKKYEGCKLKAYKCSANRTTIGYGNTYYEDKSFVMMDDEITQERAEELLHVIVAEFEDGVEAAVTKEISQNQFDSLVCFAYNVGLGNFKASTMLRLININPSDVAIPAQFLRWNKVKGIVVKGLTNRRTAEKELYCK